MSKNTFFFTNERPEKAHLFVPGSVEENEYLDPYDGERTFTSVVPHHYPVLVHRRVVVDYSFPLSLVMIGLALALEYGLKTPAQRRD